MNNYEQQANDFCEKTGTVITVNYSRTGKHFDDDKGVRDIYDVTIKNKRGSMSLVFGQSIARSLHFTVKGCYNNGLGSYTFNVRCKSNGGYRFLDKVSALQAAQCEGIYSVTENKRVTPTAYDILACLTKHHPGSLEDFCSEFGYDTDSIKANKIYHDVLKEYADVSCIFDHSQLEELAEIQ